MTQHAALAETPLAELERILADPNRPTAPTETYTFAVPKDFESPYVDVIARELYARNIVSNGGILLPDGRLKTWPTSQKNWDAVLHYIGTLIDPNARFEQPQVMNTIEYVLKGASAKSPRPDSSSVLRNLVDMGILEREDGSSRVWRTLDRGYPMSLEDSRCMKPRF
ncbi:hypothetical protein HDU80_007318 [Chytriomyces hyalinus]|nr:hypothetical protein HDU80_007318 [Chytriomyces hyalinus]